MLRGSSANHQAVVSSSNNRLGVYNHNNGGFIDSGYDLLPSASANGKQYSLQLSTDQTPKYISMTVEYPKAPLVTMYMQLGIIREAVRFAKYLDDFRVYGVTLSTMSIPDLFKRSW